MQMKDIRDIQIRIRERYSPKELSPEILCEMVHILFDYLNNQPERTNPDDHIEDKLEMVCDVPTSENK